MSIEQLAALAEIVASVGVIFSLVYVARQLSQNTKTMKMSASSRRIDRDFELVGPILADKAMAEVWIKGEDQFSSLDETDKARLLFFERRAIMLWYNMFKLYNEDLLEEDIWKEQEWIIDHVGNRQAVHAAWEMFRGGYNKEFQNYIDQRFAQQNLEH